MRSFILMGAIIIGNSINPSYEYSELTGIAIGLFLVVGALMDGMEFLYRKI